MPRTDGEYNIAQSREKQIVRTELWENNSESLVKFAPLSRIHSVCFFEQTIRMKSKQSVRDLSKQHVQKSKQHLRAKN